MATHDPTLPPQPFSIAIIGGGLGGLALAIGLSKQNVRIHIYEAAPAFSEIGAGVAFGPNSIRALELIDPRLLEGYKRHATYNEDVERETTFVSLRLGMPVKKLRRDSVGPASERMGGNGEVGDLICHLDDEQEICKRTGTQTRSCIHRARLLDELIELVPRDITSFKKSLVSAEQMPDNGGVLLKFSDGTEATADAVVGCDGIKSKVREAMYGDKIKPRFCEEYAYRVMPSKAVAESVLGRELTVNGQMYCGYGRYAISYPVERGEMTNIVGFVRTPGVTWDSDEPWQIPATKAEMMEDLKGLPPGILELLGKNPNLQRWGLFDLGHDQKYHKGRICLMGDAAHGTTPHLGAGAGMAMEDAFILSNMIGMAKSVADVEKAFETYDAVRRPRTQELIRRSLVTAQDYCFSNTEISDSLEDMVRDVKKNFFWVWHEDLEKELELAKSLMM